MFNYLVDLGKIENNFDHDTKDKPSGSQGSHFDIAFPGKDPMDVALGVFDSVDRGESVTYRNPYTAKRSKAAVIYSKPENHLAVSTILVDDQVYTAYPVNNKFKTFSDCSVLKVTEWANELEAWIHVQLLGNKTLCFFPLDYYKKRSNYITTKPIKLELSAFAYDLKKHDEPWSPNESEAKNIQKMDRFTALLNMQAADQNAFDDDYFFDGEIKKVMTGGKDDKICEVEFSAYHSTKTFRLNIFVRKQLIKEELKEGDHISGKLWLQGRIAS